LRGVNTTPKNTIEQIDAIFRAQTKPIDAPVSMKHHELVLHPGPPARLAYRVIYARGAAAEPWEYVLDERTGETLSATRLVMEAKKRVSTTLPVLDSSGAIPSASPRVTTNKPIAVYKVQVDLKTADPSLDKPMPDATRPQSIEKSSSMGRTEHQVGPPPNSSKSRLDTGKEKHLSPPPDEISTTRKEGRQYAFSA
jgi:hypothetical protein